MVRGLLAFLSWQPSRNRRQTLAGGFLRVTESGAFSKFGRTREEIENESSKKLAQFLLVARGDCADPSACRCPAYAQPTDLCQSLSLRRRQTLPGRMGLQGEVGPRR